MTQTLANPVSTTCRQQPWLSSATWDSTLIIAPAFVSSLLALAFRSTFDGYSDLPLWAWVSFVLLVDVAHVYATLFRTYFDEKVFARNKGLLLIVPLICWAVGCLLHSIDGLLFWTALAYLAVFHFIRQQYGFVMLYSRKDPEEYAKYRWLDSAVLYMATVYPLLYWHTHLPRNFNWFVEGDFFEQLPLVTAHLGLIVYLAIGTLYLIKEVCLVRTTGFLNIPKNLIIAGTALSWWVGIVALNSDMAFTMTNVLTHGIPYMALIWLYHRTRRIPQRHDVQVERAAARTTSVQMKTVALTYAPLFLFILAVFAYFEEGLWDGFVWREHLSLFPIFNLLPPLSDTSILAVLIPLLALPQSTHYVLDGFIWRIKDRDSIWSA